jgi:DNA helicase IV
MTTHPDLAEEQAYVDHAYACLERSREDAWRLRDLTEVGRGGTHQARYEAEVFEGAISQRLTRLELGDAALVFGRIDRFVEGGIESFHIGRLAVADEEREPVVVDWRAPVAEPFYRATGRHVMGLARRRHFAVKGRLVLGLEDELFGEGHLGVGPEAPEGLRGYSTLLAALERGRTGTLGDIVATIQAEQDEIIRSPQAGVLVVQGGPGTGKTVVALHRAAYLLYTHRFPLEDQGVLVIGPNRLFLRYIEQVLPSLGEAGVEQVVLSDLVPDVRFGAKDRSLTARVKGDVRMAEVLAKAVRDRERPLKHDLVLPFGLGHLRLRAEDSDRIVRDARRRYRRHNAARKFVEGEVMSALAASARDGNATVEQVRDRLRHTDDMRAALERMWPQLTPAELLNDLFGSAALLKLAGSKWLAEDEYLALRRERAHDPHDQVWSDVDAPLLDEARALLGPKPVKGQRSANRNPDGTPAPIDDEIRTYGHIVIDEVQDLSPMALRMAARRSLNGSMTVVGDLVQATGEHAASSWDDVLAHLPDRKPPRVVGLSVGYRIPETIMELADRVAEQALPGLRSPRSVRPGENPPQMVPASAEGLVAAIAGQIRRLQDDLGDGVVAVITPDSMADEVLAALADHGIEAGQASRVGLEQPVTVVPVGLVKGLELDGVIVVEPARIVREQVQGLRALYVALTRATRELAVVHSQPLPF